MTKKTIATVAAILATSLTLSLPAQAQTNYDYITPAVEVQADGDLVHQANFKFKKFKKFHGKGFVGKKKFVTKKKFVSPGFKKKAFVKKKFFY